MSVRDRIAGFLRGQQRPAQRIAPSLPIGRGARHGSRSLGAIDAGIMDRLTTGFMGSSNSIDRDIYGRLERIRARSRGLAYNNPYMRRFLAMCSRHIIGPTGPTITFSPLLPDGTVDQLDARALTRAFWDWAKPETADIMGRLSFVQMLHQIVRAVARDGECIVREVYGPDAGKYGYALQLLDIDRLDDKKNERLPSGNIIKMGVELTPFGKPVALWLHRKHPGDTLYFDAERRDATERVSLDECHHLFLFDRPEQTRGLPWAISSIINLNHLGRTEEAAVVAARVGAAKMGFWVSPDGTPDALADGEDAAGNLLSDADPGTIAVAPAGYQFQQFDPKYPDAQFEPFAKGMLRGIASGLDVSAVSLSNDLRDVNFSSIRAGVLEEREAWMLLQNWIIESFIDPVTSKWLQFALLNGAVLADNGTPLPLSRFAKFNSFTWRGRRWQWVDPRNDAETARILVKELRVRSRRMIADESGVDLDLVFQELADEEQQMKAMGLNAAETPPPPEAV